MGSWSSWLRIGSNTVHFGFHERRKIVGLAGTFFTHITKLYRSCTTIIVAVNTRYTSGTFSFSQIPTKTNKNCIILKLYLQTKHQKRIQYQYHVRPANHGTNKQYSGALAQSQNALISFAMSVHPQSIIAAPQWTDFRDVWYWGLLNAIEKIQIWLKLGKKVGHFTRRRTFYCCRRDAIKAVSLGEKLSGR